MSCSVAQITFEPLWTDHGIPLAIMGMLVVFLALVLVSSFIILLPQLMMLLDRLHPQLPAAHGTKIGKAKPAASRSSDGIPEEFQVVIAAAVAEVIAAPHRIVRTRRQTPEEHSWSLEGRMQHHTSHSGRGREGR